MRPGGGGRLLLTAALLCPGVVPAVARAATPGDCAVTSVVTGAAGDRAQIMPRSGASRRSGLLSVPIYTSPGNNEREVVDGVSGHTLWRLPRTGYLIARFTASSYGRAGAAAIRELSVGIDQRSCSHLVASTIDARTGRLLWKPVWSPILVAPSSRWLNVVSAAAAEAPGSGFADTLIEVREGDTDPSLGRTYEPHQYRDISPGLAKRGQVWLVDGQSQNIRRLTAQPALVGPGPMSTTYGPAAAQQAAVLTEEASSLSGQQSVVTGYSHGRQTWRTLVPTLPSAWTAVGLPSGPVFATASSAFPDSLPAAATSKTLITALQGSTGKVLWEKSFVSSGGFAVHRLQGDVLVDNQSLGQLTRLRGDSGATVWTRQYVWQARHDHPVMGDVDGDGVQDLLMADSAEGPAIVSGATGALLPRPLFSLAPDYLFAVGDLNGDGAADVVGLPGVSQAIGAFTTVSSPAIAFSGRTGQVLWACSLPATASSIDVVDGNLGGTQGDDVVVEYLSGSQYLVDGRTGAILWTHEDAA